MNFPKDSIDASPLGEVGAFKFDETSSQGFSGYHSTVNSRL
jgi:hypothetical protein